MSRRFTLPSFLSPKHSLSSKRSTVTAAAAAGTLAVAIAAGAAAGALPGHSAAAGVGSTVVASTDTYVTTTGGHQGVAAATQAPTLNGAQLVIDSQRARFVLQHSEDVTAAKAAASRAAAAEAAAAKAAAAKAAAAKAAAAKAAAAKAAAAKARQVAEPSGSPRLIAEQTLRQFGWPSGQFSCLEPLWERESGWDVTAENPSSGAYGIPQALSGSLMASAGPDWQTNAATQVHWGLSYIQGRYGSPCGAWAHEQADGWY